jgi:hypothetical protein
MMNLKKNGQRDFVAGMTAAVDLRRDREAQKNRSLSGRRGPAGRSARRRDEKTIRGFVAQEVSVAMEKGMRLPKAAKELGMQCRTLRNWMSKCLSKVHPAPQGRPAIRGTVQERNTAFHALEIVGPGASVALLGTVAPKLNRPELREMKRRYKKMHRRRRKKCVFRLIHRPQSPGTAPHLERENIVLPSGLSPV